MRRPPIPPGMEQAYGFPPGGAPFGGPPGGLGSGGSGAGGPPAAPPPPGGPLAGVQLVYEVFRATEFWTRPQSSLVFGPVDPVYSPGVPGAIGQAVWRTPLFDLRTDLEHRSGYAANAAEVGRNTLMGDQFWLHVQLFGFNSAVQVLAAAAGMRWYALEFIATTNPDDVQIVGTAVDLTGDAFQANAASGSQWFSFVPLGHVRYWGVALVVEISAAFAPTTPLMLSAALH